MHHVLRSRRLPTDPSILMNWVNALIESDFCSLEDLRSGIVWCHLLEAIYPGSIDLESLEADKMGWQWNYRVLKRALNNLGLYPHINVHELVSGRVGDTIYLLHFFIDVFTVILGRKIKDREHHSSKEPRNFKSSSTIEVIVQWFKSFFVKEKEDRRRRSQTRSASWNFIARRFYCSSYRFRMDALPFPPRKWFADLATETSGRSKMIEIIRVRSDWRLIDDKRTRITGYCDLWWNPACISGVAGN
ncbi:uncharacterized protein LOC108049682 isoform X2 [Drosophila rhopaloa]|uniref:Uncharacterized protein LOC108049682 isoform X2 n=1 Tax=Drosophila rhopaloa TaxID=1041015 RepID=A0A6P4F7M8_DRORH|nr:uncharacterized protein LOC108049682 isoform X2 [Drosophila rhopaloa]